MSATPLDESVPAASGGVRRWLRVEGLTVLSAAIFIYARTGHSWLLFVILFLTPDISFVGYVLGPRTGAATYNIFHSYIVPVVLGCGMWVAGRSIAIPLIWAVAYWIRSFAGIRIEISDRFWRHASR